MTGWIGQMVRAGGQPMKVADISYGVAKCIVVDNEGRIRYRFHPVDHITPLWLSMQPRSMWPEITNVDLLAIEKEERAAKKAKLRQSRKARRSNKIKRGTVPG